MQHSQPIRSRVHGFIVFILILLFLAAIPATAHAATWTYTSGSTYSTRSNSMTRSYTSRSYASNSGYYSTSYGWVGTRSTAGTSPVYRPSTPSTPAPAPQTPATPANPTGVTAEEAQMVNLVNQERAKAGLAPLTIEPQLVEIARIKSQDMIAANYFGHTSPSFGSTLNLVRQRGLSYTSAGENLAGAGNVATAHSMLMNSAGHRANIMNAGFSRIGIGIVRGGPYGAMFTQLFLGR